MGVTGTEGVFSFGPQSAKGVVPTKWYKHRAISVDIDQVDPVQLGPSEVGGIAIPTFPYKTGPITTGSFSLQPRMENTFGWLLFAMLGKVTTSVVDTDNYDHVFEMDTVPWLGVRKHIPRVDGAADSDLGQIGLDGKLLSSMVNISNGSPITTQHSYLGAKLSYDMDPTTWTYENADYEDWQSIPLTTVATGSLNFGGSVMKVVSARIGFVNQPLPLEQEKQCFSPFIDGVTIIKRMMTVELVVKYEDPDLYMKVRTGEATGSEWTATPHTGSFSVEAHSSVNMPSTTPVPYSLKIEASNIMLQQDGGLTLAPDQTVLQKFTGVAIEGGSFYTQWTLRNMVSGYTWPV